MYLFGKGRKPHFFVAENAATGIFDIAEKVALDFELVMGARLEVSLITPEGIRSMLNRESVPLEYANGIICMTAENTLFVDELDLDLSELSGKNEVYGYFWRDNNLIICGSDKRGTIYGLFHLSELIGVSPLLYWGDALPQALESLEISTENFVSREPSVRYRGFFINDEWPCFGNWTMKHFGGFNADMYDHVFELLLRLKGNYLWPAMWTSSFALDGPGDRNAELADKYGVILGNSHHEPCLRAGEEWDIYKGEDTCYKTQWNYLVNKEGLLNFWRDGLKRSGKYETMITVGMRGERDSVLQGPNSLAENIEVLKDIITEQKKLIKENVANPRHPQLLAIYKEVERYFYGDETTPGLKEWEGLDDLLLLFCEDNFGHMRYLPEKGMRGLGYGMYYHLDYHGDPISYEWINSTPLASIWEQMTLAYEQGVKDLWIVNVGDLKGNEFPLSYFLDMAYDFDRWGSSNVNSPAEYTREWVRRHFGHYLDINRQQKLVKVITDGIWLIGRRRPEALTPDTYWGEEADRVLSLINEINKSMKEIEEILPEIAQISFHSLVKDQLDMGLNLIELMIYAGKNHHYAKQGKVLANHYRDLLSECIKRDQVLVQEANARNNGKWEGMWTGSHIGFRKWNEDGCRVPALMEIVPFGSPRMIVSKAGENRIYQKNYGQPETVHIWELAGNRAAEVTVEIANDGLGEFEFELIKTDCDWLNIEVSNRSVKQQETLRISARETEAKTDGQILVRSNTNDVEVLIVVHAEGQPTEEILIDKRMADDYSQCSDNIIIIKDFGYQGSALKASPFTEKVGESFVAYDFYVRQEGQYELTFHFAPSNPISKGHRLEFELEINGQQRKTCQLLPKDYRAGEASDVNWSRAVIRQEHTFDCRGFLEEGSNQIKLFFADGILALERVDLKWIF